MSDSINPSGIDQSQAELGNIGMAEDLARSDLYGLLAAFYLKAPEQAYLDSITASAPQEKSLNEVPPLLGVWLNLISAARDSQASDWHSEYAAEFAGVGRPNIYLNSSFYLAGHLHERPLVEVRRALTQFGLESSDDVTETEDHVSALFEVMRYLIAGDDVEISNLTNQRVFFNDHIRPWYDDLCDAIEANSELHLYRPVAALTREFLAIEGQAFDMM